MSVEPDNIVNDVIASMEAESSVMATTFDIVEAEYENFEKKSTLSSTYTDFSILSNIDSTKSAKIPPENGMNQLVLTPKDTRDPSYSNLTLPYRVVCRQRLHRNAEKMKNQFLKELRFNELFQDKALDGVRLRRIFCNTTIQVPKSNLVTLTNEEKFKLEKIMDRPL